MSYPLCIWYGRDNHTTRRLPLDIEGALRVLRDEFDRGCAYGMVFSRGGPMDRTPVHAGSTAEWHVFAAAVREWFPLAIRELPAEAEYQSWIALLNMPVCHNCDTAMPEGCGGLFRDDGQACMLNRALGGSDA